MLIFSLGKGIKREVKESQEVIFESIREDMKTIYVVQV